MPFSSPGVQVRLNETTENWEGKILKSNEKHSRIPLVTAENILKEQR